MFRMRSVLVSVSVFALFSLAASAAPPPASPKNPRKPAAHHPAGKTALPPPGPGGPPGIALEPENWFILDVPSADEVAAEGTSLPSTVSLDQHVYVLHGDAGVSESPLDPSTKEALAPTDDISISTEDIEDPVYVVSQEITEGIEASLAAGVLTPEIDAIAEPLDDPASSTLSSAPTKSIFGGSCATHQQTINKTISLNGRTYGKSYDLGDGFTGSYSITGQLAGTVTAEITFDIKRRNVLGKCVPYSLKFKNVHAFGNATSTGGITLNGSIAYQSSFGPSEVAKPELFNVWFTVGPIPVNIGFNLPISAGLDMSANVAGTINYNGTHVASGTFDYVCTLDNCTGGGSFDNSGVNGSTQTITGSVSGHVKPVPYVDIGFRAYLYTESVAYAQVGVRPHLLGDLWGYAGNNCGDADGDGNFESVHALTFDLDRRIDLTGQASVFGLSPWQRTLRTGAVAHVGFYKLIDSDAIQPQLQGPGTLSAGTAGQYQVKIRPCWPYTDNVTYQLNWGDGSAVQELTGAPGTNVAPSHTWTAAGSPAVTATSSRDQHGRVLNQGFSRTVQVTPPTALTLTVTPSPASVPYGTPITWTANAGGGNPATLKFALFRRRSGTTSWTPDVTAPAWQASNILSWTPAAADAGAWDIIIWIKDGGTPANANTYGYAAYYSPGAVQVIVPQSYPAKGWVDGYNPQHIWGWACDPDFPTQSNRVDVYNTNGQQYGSASASIGSVAAINSECRGGTAHYFDFYPSGGIPSGTHFNVWSMDLPYTTAGNQNRKLGGVGAIGDGTEFVIP